MEEKQYISLEFLVWTETRQTDSMATGEPIYTTHRSIRIDDNDIEDMSDKDFKEYIINKLIEIV